MKKFLLTLLILLGLGSLTACQLNFDPVYGEHEHEITGEFGYYEQIHWNICATCDEKVDKAWHSFGPWQRVSDDSLEERRTCLCGYYESRFHSHSLTGNVLYDDNEHYEECEKCFDHVNAVAHTYGEWTVGRESTEDVQGYELQVCSCGHTVYRSLPLKNHVHVWDGTYGITEDGHWKNCVKESCTMDEVDLLVPHNGGQATCTEDAVCVECGYHYEEAFGHDYESVVTNPTCTEKGYTTHTCKKGDHTYVDSYVDALGHDYESVVTNPTCTEKGYTTHTCKKGDHTYVDSYVDELGHAYGEVTYTWTDYASVTATRVCGNDATHVETETVNTVYSVLVEPGKLTVGTGRYTATFTNPAFAVQTKDVEIPATGITYTTSGTGTAVTYDEATNTYAFEVELAQWGNFQVRLNNELLSVATTNVSGLYCGHNGSDWTEKLYGEQADLTTFYTSTGGTYVVYYNATTDTLSVGLKGFYYTHPSGRGLIEAGEDGNYAITLDFAQWNRVSFMYYDKYITIDDVTGDVVDNYNSSIFKLYIENDNYTYISSCAETTTYKFVYNPETNTLDVDLQGLYYRFVTATGFKDVKVDIASNGHYLFEKDFVQWNNISLNYNGEWVKFANVEGNITNDYNDSFNKLYIDGTDYTFISSQASKTYNFDFDPETGKLVIYLEGLFYEHTSANGLAEFNNGVYKVKLDFAQWNRVSFKYNGELVRFADVTGHITNDYNDSHYKLYIDGDDYTYLSSQNNRTYIFEYNPETGKLDIALEGLYYEHTSSKGLAQLEGNVYAINLDFNQWNRVTFKYNGQYVKFSNVTGDVAENGNSAINKLYIDTNEVNDYTYLSSANGSRTYRFEYNAETSTLNVALQGLAYEHSNGYGMLEMNEHGTYTVTFDFNQWNRVSFKYNGQYVTIDNTSGSVSSNYDGSYYKLYIDGDNYTYISSINTTTTYSFTYTPETNKLDVDLQGLYYRHTTGQGFTDGKVPVGEDGKYVLEKSMATWNNIVFVYKSENISTSNTTISGTFVNQADATWTHMLYTTNGSELIASYGSALNYLFSYDPESKSLSVCLADLSYETRSATYGNSTYDEVHKVYVVTFVTKIDWEVINIKFNGQSITLDNTTIKGLYRGTNYGADWTENLYHDDANSHESFASCIKDITYKLVYSEETNTLIIGLANDPIEHSWKDATCTEAKTCTVCGETAGTALGHTPKEAVQENVVPSTCTKTGSYDSVVYCSVCDAKLSSESKTSELAPHTEVTVSGKAASCTETGLTDGKKCSVCGETTLEQTEVPLEKHNYVDGICSVCDGIDPNHYFVVAITEAKAAADGAKVSVSGTVSAINTAWSESYGNITVTITDTNGDTLNIYRMKTNVQLGDIITVKGVMATHDGSRQIGAGSTAEITGHDTSYDYKEMSISEALASDDNTNVIIKGTVVKIGTAYSSSYNNISLYIADENGTQIYLYRLAGNYSVGQVIKVQGTMATYNESRQVTGATAEVLDESVPAELVLLYAKSLTTELSKNVLNTDLPLPTSLNILNKDYSVEWKVNNETVNKVVYSNPSEETIVTAQITISINDNSHSYDVAFTLAASGSVVYPENYRIITKVTSLNQLVDGAQILIAYESNIMGLQNGNYRLINTTDGSFVSANSILLESGYSVITLEKDGDYWRLKSSDTKYLTSPSANNYLKETTAKTSYEQWAISMDGESMVVNNVGRNNYYLQYNSNSGQERFSCYKKTQKNTTFYILSLPSDSGETPDPTPEPQKLATPTVTISGEGLASWEAVANASGYTYKINDGAETTITTTSVQLTDGQTIVVKALGDGENYLDSDYSVSQQYDAPEVEEPDEGKTYSYTFASKQFTANGTKTLNGVNWTLAGNGGYWGFDSNNGRGQQFGSGSKPYTSMTLTSDSFSNVSKITINTSGASSIVGTCIITVGGVQIGNITLTSSAKEYSFTLNEPLSGEIVISYTQTSSKAIYIKSLEVEYK